MSEGFRHQETPIKLDFLISGFEEWKKKTFERSGQSLTIYIYTYTQAYIHTHTKYFGLYLAWFIRFNFNKNI